MVNIATNGHGFYVIHVTIVNNNCCCDEWYIYIYHWLKNIFVCGWFFLYFSKEGERERCNLCVLYICICVNFFCISSRKGREGAGEIWARATTSLAEKQIHYRATHAKYFFLFCFCISIIFKIYFWYQYQWRKKRSIIKQHTPSIPFCHTDS